MWESGQTPIHPMRLMREIDSFMDQQDDIVVADGGDTATWMGMTRIIRKGGTYLDYGIYGGLGVGIPFAMAAKLKNPDKRVLLIIGDGSVWSFKFMEFHTAIRKKLPIVVVICNDQSWGMIMHSQQLRLGHHIRRERNWDGWITIKWSRSLAGSGYVWRGLRISTRHWRQRLHLGKLPVSTSRPILLSSARGSVALANLGGYKTS